MFFLFSFCARLDSAQGNLLTIFTSLILSSLNSYGNWQWHCQVALNLCRVLPRLLEHQPLFCAPAQGIGKHCTGKSILSGIVHSRTKNKYCWCRQMYCSHRGNKIRVFMYLYFYLNSIVFIYSILFVLSLTARKEKYYNGVWVLVGMVRMTKK